MITLGLSMTYGGIPDDRQIAIGCAIFLATYALPLIAVYVASKLMPPHTRKPVSTAVAVIAALLAGATPGGVLLEGFALFFAVIALSAALDMMHLGELYFVFGFFLVLFSALIVFGTTQPAFIHAIRCSYRY